MEFRHHPDYEGHIYVSTVVPMHLMRYRLRHAKVRYVKCAAGEILSQQIVGKHFSIWVHRFFLTEDITLYAFVDHLCRTLNYNRKGSLWCELVGYGKVYLKQGLYGLFCVPPHVHHPCYFTAGEYCFMHVDLQDELLSRIDYNPYCKKALAAYLKNPKHNGVQLKAVSMHLLVKDIIRKISDCKDEPADAYIAKITYHVEHLLYEFNTQIQEIIMETQQQLMAGRIASIILSIEGNLDVKYTRQSLAQEHQMTEITLHRYFKAVKGISAREFILNCKMEGARTLLTTTDNPIEVIAEDVGYKEPSDFVRAYKKHFGIIPSQERGGCQR